MVYQEVHDLKLSITENSILQNLDLSCFDGKYVAGDIDDDYLDWVESEYLS